MTNVRLLSHFGRWSRNDGPSPCGRGMGDVGSADPAPRSYFE
jgi:hypothetical protein